MSPSQRLRIRVHAAGLAGWAIIAIPAYLLLPAGLWLAGATFLSIVTGVKAQRWALRREVKRLEAGR